MTSLRLRPYAQSPVRAAGQVLIDLSILAWVYAWVRVGQLVHTSIAAASGAGTALDSGAEKLAGGLRSAAGMAAQVPFVGDRLAAPLQDAAGAAAGVGRFGTDFAAQIQTFATWTGLYVAALPIVVGLLVWAVPRYRFARRAALTARLLVTPGGESVLALRALVTRPLDALNAVHPEAVAAWRAGDPYVVGRLAELEATRSGVRPRTALPALTAAGTGHPVLQQAAATQPLPRY